jgi:hypothetical protein
MFTTPHKRPPQSSGPPHSRSHSKPSQYKAAFCNLIAKEWIPLDDQGQALVASIVNLRERCHAITQAQARYHTDSQGFSSQASIALREPASTTLENPSLYTSPLATYWTRQDANMALSYTLQQHESAMAALRSTVAQLSSIQDVLARKWEYIYSNSSDGDLEECRLVYTALAEEVYRKQILANKVLDASLETMFYTDGDEKASATVQESLLDGLEPQSCQAVARACLQEWPRTHKDSCVKDHVVVLTEWQQDYQRKELQREGS